MTCEEAPVTDIALKAPPPIVSLTLTAMTESRTITVFGADNAIAAFVVFALHVFETRQFAIVAFEVAATVTALIPDAVFVFTI